MKKLLCVMLAAVMILCVCACGKTSDGKQGSDSGDQQGQSGNNAASGAIVGVKSDLYAPNVGSQAEKYWKVKEIQTVYEFDKNGKCTVRDTVYYLKDASDYEEVKAALEGSGWTVTWNADKTAFANDRGFKDYTTVDDAIEEMEKEFRGYTLTYSGGGTKYVAPPTEEQMTAKTKEVFGFTFDEIKTSYGNFEYSYTRQRDKVLVTYISGASVEDINALAKAAFEVCKPLADEGKVYNYLGKYGDVLESAPEVESIFNSATFNYFRNGTEITVQSEILNSEGHDNTLALLVSVVK